MKREYNIAGFGGQGILYLGQILAFAGMLANKESTWIPSYGPEMRGGTANCVVVISSDPVRSPLVYSPDTAVILNQPSLKKYGPLIKPGGDLLLVSEFVTQDEPMDDIHVYRVPAKSLAESIKAPMALNMVMLGALVALDSVVTQEHVEDAICQVTPAHRRQLVDVNIRAVKEGLEHMKASLARGGGGHGPCQN